MAVLDSRVLQQYGALPFSIAEVTPARLLMQMQVISDRRDPNAAQSTLRRWVVEDGRVGALEA